MKAAILVGQLTVGGMETQLVRHLGALNDEFSTRVFVLRGRTDARLVGVLEALGIEVEVVPSMRSLLFAVRKFRPEIVHSWSFYLNPLAAVMATLLRIRSLGSVRGTLSDEIARAGVFGHVAARYPRIQTCNSKSACRDAGALLRKAMYLPNLPDPVLKDQVAKTYPASARVLGSVGGLRPDKGWFETLDVFARVRERCGDVELRIAGDGSELAALRAHVASDKRLAESVEFLGQVTDIREFFDSVDIQLHLSPSEGASNAIMEGQLCGVPAVVNDVGDNSVLVAHTESGLVVSSIDEVPDVLLSLLADTETLEVYSEAALLNSASWYSAATTLANIYRGNMAGQ